MAKLELNRQAKIYVWSITLLGVALGALLIARGDPLGWDWAPVTVFGVLAILSTSVSITFQGFLPSKLIHQTGSSFAYAVLLLADPGAAVVVLWATATMDWAIHRRYWLTLTFNLGQLSLALGAALAVRSLLFPGFQVLERIDPASMAAMLATVTVFAVVNHLLTHVVLNLSSGHSALRFRLVRFAGIATEASCVVSGISMAIFWWIRPWLIPLGFLPLGVLVLSLYRLGRRENEHVIQQAQLKSLQELGLEIGSQLDADKLHGSIVRVATEAMNAAGSVLAVRDDRSAAFRLVACHGVAHELPGDPVEGPWIERVLSSDEIVLLEETGDLPPPSFPEARGWLLAPLEILDERSAILGVFHTGERRRFDAEDVARLGTLVRFTDMALSNASLVTNLKQMQEQLVQTEKMSALGMLVSGVAHELNNPLTSVLGYADLLLREEPDGRKRSMLETVTDQADRARRIVRNLLTFSRKRRPEKRPCDANRLLREILDMRAYDLRVKNIRLRRSLAAELPEIRVDPHQFQQVFLNLLTNAEHAVSETVGERRILVETSVEDKSVRIVVEDNGPGISGQDIDKIFLPFFTTKETGRGTGLGLSICYGIVEEHGGRIRVESLPAGGARFIVHLPVYHETASIMEEERPGARTGPEPTGHLLVVDDEETITTLIRDALEPKGWEVMTAPDGRQGLDMLERNRVDAILVDLRMPGMDGPAFFGELQRIRPELASRVVFTTGDSGNPTTMGFLRDRSNPVLAKPFTVEDLLSTMYRIL